MAPDGKIFFLGSQQNTAFLNTAKAGKWITGPTRLFGSRGYGSAVMYDAGKILVVRGGAPLGSAERIDLLGTRQWTQAGSMTSRGVRSTQPCWRMGRGGVPSVAKMVRFQ